MDVRRYESAYSEAGFWQKLAKFAKKAGEQAVYTALLLYYSLQNPDVPRWAKTVILGSLGYFIVPVDLIPDLAPVIGFTDDLGALLAALTVISRHLRPEDRTKAKEKVARWFAIDDAAVEDDCRSEHEV